MFDKIRIFQEEFEEAHGVRPDIEIRVHGVPKKVAEDISVVTFLNNKHHFNLPQAGQNYPTKWISTNARTGDVRMTIFYQEDKNEENTADNNNSDDSYGDFGCYGRDGVSYVIPDDGGDYK